MCNFCGFIWICDTFIHCPFCNGGDYKDIPMEDNKYFNFDNLHRIGFSFLKERLNNNDSSSGMLNELEIRNLRDMYMTRLDIIVDPDEYKCIQASICILDCVLNE